MQPAARLESGTTLRATPKCEQAQAGCQGRPPAHLTLSLWKFLPEVTVTVEEATTMPAVTSSRPSRRSKQAVVPGIAREDSDDELGVDDHPWEWIYADVREASPAGGPSRKRKRALVDEEPAITGARMGSFVCRVGDIVLLKAETSGEAWIAIIRDFLEDEDGEMAADFLWFSSEKEIRNKHKKRTDFFWVSDPFSCQGEGGRRQMMTSKADFSCRTSCT